MWCLLWSRQKCQGQPLLCLMIRVVTSFSSPSCPKRWSSEPLLPPATCRNRCARTIVTIPNNNCRSLWWRRSLLGDRLFPCGNGMCFVDLFHILKCCRCFISIRVILLYQAFIIGFYSFLLFCFVSNCRCVCLKTLALQFSRLKTVFGCRVGCSF